MIKSVIKLEKGMVMVFDEEDEQMPEYQGPYEEVRERILADASALDVLFWHDEGRWLKAVNKGEW